MEINYLLLSNMECAKCRKQGLLFELSCGSASRAQSFKIVDFPAPLAC